MNCPSCGREIQSNEHLVNHDGQLACERRPKPELVAEEIADDVDVPEDHPKKKKNKR